jgi:GlpG protein
MRRLASFDDPIIARSLCEVLYAANIDSDLREGPERAVTVWVLAENDMDRAQGILEAFVARPEAREYAVARALAEQKRAAETQPQPRPSQVPPVIVRKTLRERIADSPVTFGMIGVCIVVALVTELGNRADMVSHLTIASFERSGGMLRWYGYRDLLDGQVWRVITPIFIHFGPFHLLFNSFWMNDLGAPTERIQGSFRHVLFVLWSAALSNVAQLAFGHSPTFGGMSGIVYAYVGYLWARGRADPGSGVYLPGRLVLFFVAWMALGFSELLDEYIGAMANYCHLGGFVAGLGYGWISGLHGRSRSR